MSFDVRESQASSRILAAAEALAAQYNLAVPEAFSSMSGGPVERNLQRAEAVAQFLENIFLEGVSPGLSLEIQRFTDVAMLRGASEADLKEVVGITNKATVKKLRAALKAQGSVEAMLAGGEAPDMKTMVEELSEGDDNQLKS